MPEVLLSIAVADEATRALQVGADRFAREEDALPENGARRLLRRRQVAPPVHRLRYADAGPRMIDQPMRLPSFNETCPHVRDQIIPLNGGRFNVDHYLRVLRAKAELDVSIAMALTSRVE